MNRPDVREATAPPVAGGPPTTTASAQSPLRAAFTFLGLVALLGSALVGGNVGGSRERLFGSETPTARSVAVSRAPQAATGGPEATTATTAPSQQTVLRSQPWWQSVGAIQGSGSMTAAPFTVDPGAIQWRVKWTCSSGHLLVRSPGQTRPVVDANCPGPDVGYGVQKGNVALQVTADGPWQMQVDQQVDVPLTEPPLPAMTAPGSAPVLAGPFYRIDQVGTGTATVYRLPDGSYALRLDNFFVTANSDLELQFSPLDAPKTTDQVNNARSATVASLDVTTGALNFAIPPQVDPTKYKSLVIWCEQTHNAYAAASLKPA